MTFAGIFDQLGLVERGNGLFTEFADLGNGDDSNVFTAFRGLIEDFGLAGALVFMAFLGALSDHLYQRLRAARSLSLVPIFGITACWLLYSPIVSLFSYTSNVAGTLLLATYLWLFTSARAAKTQITPQQREPSKKHIYGYLPISAAKSESPSEDSLA